MSKTRGTLYCHAIQGNLIIQPTSHCTELGLLVPCRVSKNKPPSQKNIPIIWYMMHSIFIPPPKMV